MRKFLCLLSFIACVSIARGAQASTFCGQNASVSSTEQTLVNGDATTAKTIFTSPSGGNGSFVYGVWIMSKVTGTSPYLELSYKPSGGATFPIVDIGFSNLTGQMQSGGSGTQNLLTFSNAGTNPPVIGSTLDECGNTGIFVGAGDSLQISGVSAVVGGTLYVRVPARNF